MFTAVMKIIFLFFVAAASLKFKGADREELAEMFGKSLAGSKDWNKRNIRPSDYSVVQECSLTFTDELIE